MARAPEYSARASGISSARVLTGTCCFSGAILKEYSTELPTERGGVEAHMLQVERGGKRQKNKNKNEPAASTAHHIFKSFNDLKKRKAETNNGTFSIIYNSDVQSVRFDELPELSARRASFVRARSLLFAAICVVFFFLLGVASSHPLISARVEGGETYQEPGSNKGTVTFCPVTSGTVLSLVCQRLLWVTNSETCTNLSIIVWGRFGVFFFLSLFFSFYLV